MKAHILVLLLNFFFFSVHQGVLNIPFAEIPHWWVQLTNQSLKYFISICSAALCTQLWAAILCRIWRPLTCEVTHFPLHLEKVLSTLIQNIAHARFPFADRCHEAVGSLWELVVSSGLVPICLVAFWPPSHACCTLAAF